MARNTRLAPGVRVGMVSHSAWAIAIAAAACGPTVAPAPVAPAAVIDPGAPGAPGSAAPSPAPIAELADLVGGPPASSPRGEPIAIAFVPVKVGDARQRTESTIQRYDTTWSDGVRHQVTQRWFRMREQIAALDAGRVASLQVDVDDAREQTTENGELESERLLEGQYIVGLHASASNDEVDVRHVPGREIDSREEEELATLFQLDRGDEPAIAQVVRAHPLRLGESIALDDAAKAILAHGAAMPEPIALTLVDVSHGAATYQVDVTTATSVLRYRYALALATGHLVAIVLDSSKHTVESGLTSDERAHVAVTFE